MRRRSPGGQRGEQHSRQRDQPMMRSQETFVKSREKARQRQEQVRERTAERDSQKHL